MSTGRLENQENKKENKLMKFMAGSAVSSGIAALGTSAIGKATIAYYIDDQDMEEAKKNFDSVKQEKMEEKI